MVAGFRMGVLWHLMLLTLRVCPGHDGKGPDHGLATDSRDRVDYLPKRDSTNAAFSALNFLVLEDHCTISKCASVHAGPS